MPDPLSGHTAAGHPEGSDGLRDGDSLSSPTLTNLLEGVKGNGILRLQDAAYGSTRNAVTGTNQPGAIESVAGTPAYKLTVQGGYAVLDGQLYEFAGGPGNTIELELGAIGEGSGTEMLAGGTVPATNQQSMYVVYIASQGGKSRMYADGGSVVDTSKGLYPSLPSGYLTDYSGISQKNEHVIVIATVRCTYHPSGGLHRVDILEINDKRHFLSTNPIYMAPLTTGSLTTDSESKISQISRAAGEGIQTASELRSIFSGTEVGDLGTTANASTNLIDFGAMWMSTSKSGAGLAAAGSVTITDLTNINNGDKVTLIATNGTSHDFTAGDVAGGGTWVAETNNNTSATNLATQINANVRFSASANGAVVTITQGAGGVDGNTTITLVDSGTAGMSKTNFTGGTSLGFGPGNGADRDTNLMKDELFFAGQNNTESALVSKRLFTRGVSAPSAAITTSATYTITSYGDSIFILNSTATVTLKAEKSGSNYLFPEGHQIDIVNTGSGVIMFDDALITNDKTIAADYRASFVFEGSVWLRTAYETSSAAATSTFAGLSDTPALAAAAETFDAALKGLRVKSDNSAIEFYDIPSASDLLPGISDTSTAVELTITNTAITINDDGDVLDFRVESDDDTHMLFVDGANDRVGISQATPDAVFQIEEVGFGYIADSITSGANNGSTAITLDLFDVTKFRACEVLVEIEGEDGSGTDINEVAKILMTHKGSGDIPMIIYGQTQSDSTTTVSGTDQAIYTASVVGGQVQLQVTPAIDSIAVTAKVYWRAITI